MPPYCSQLMKEIIIKVHNYFETEKANGRDSIKIAQVLKRTSDCLNVSKSTVKRVLKEERQFGSIQPVKSKSGRERIELDDFFHGIIRRKILAFYINRRFPTIKELHEQLKEDVPGLPKFSQATLLRWVKKLNFSYRKLENKPILMEQNSIVAKRSQFLSDIKRYRENNWNIYYTDETWCGANHSRKFGWVEQVIPEVHENFDEYRAGIQQINGYRGSIKKPSGSGQRVIILHIGNENGFLEGCLKCFVGKKGSADYHNEMNREHYEEWFRLVLSLIPDKSVIVIDQAPYHTMLDPEFRNPTTAWPKAKIIEWMSKRQVVLPPEILNFQSLTKPRLLQLCQHYHYEKKYLLEKIAVQLRGDDMKLLWLPVAHCEFNAIELIWAYVKNKVATLNTTFKINDVLNLCTNAMTNIPISVWRNCVEHSNKIEQTYREKESIIDDALEPIIININNDDESSEDENEYAEYTSEEEIEDFSENFPSGSGS